MINELLEKEVIISVGMSSGPGSTVYGHADDIKGVIVEIQDSWLKLMSGKGKDKPVYIYILATYKLS